MNLRSFSTSFCLSFILTGILSPLLGQTNNTIQLDGDWQVSLDDRESWQAIQVPGTIEDQLDVNFDGVSIYRKELAPVEVGDSNRLYLRFEAVAIEATVYFNGKQVAKHLGGWTPFTCDISKEARETTQSPWVIEVRCDEKVGHSTQGFLPVFAPHFGGIWKSVQLLERPRLCIDEDQVGVQINRADNTLDLEIPLLTASKEESATIQVTMRPLGEPNWLLTKKIQVLPKGTTIPAGNVDVQATMEGQTLTARVPLDDTTRVGVDQSLKPWTPEQPQLYEVGLQIIPHTDGYQGTGAIVVHRIGVRAFETDGEKITCDGRPVFIRGLLNWGYAPPGNGPTLDENEMRREIELAKSRGFNLMKFCLWIPPKRYLELCDELGMMTWVEYPAWHPDFSPSNLPLLLAEYDEFFKYDRNHPSVILRSLTCETGPSADLQVVKELYRQCKTRIPNAIVEDDSSWIAWNRVHDFYDDHPYGNNHTWLATLNKLKTYISERETKPLVLGESISADTWCDPEPLLKLVGDQRPFWLPQFLDGNISWLEQMRPLVSIRAINSLYEDSLVYSRLMRKFQIETYRREVPFGGYVITVIRDIPFCAMGFLDFLGREKQPAQTWDWHAETLLLLDTDDDERSFFASQPISFSIATSQTTRELDQATLLWKLVDAEGKSVAAGSSQQSTTLNVEIEADAIRPTTPTRMTIHASLSSQGKEIAANQWPIWIVPDAALLDGISISKHTSADDLDIEEVAGPLSSKMDSPESIVVSRVVDADLLQHVKDGGHVLLLPNNVPGSLPLKSHWFLRGGPVVDNSNFFTKIDRQFFVELQHFDLAGDIVPNIQDYVLFTEPIVVLWDNHDLKHVNTHGVMFRIPFDEGGSIFVSAANHLRSSAGKFLLAETLNEIWKHRAAKPNRTEPGLLARLARESSSQSIRLDQVNWRFQPDPDHAGQSLNWDKPEFNDSNWKSIRTDRHWEGQGFDTLDGWAWYRINVDIPPDWPARAFLNFTGVDDHYRLYVNGQFVGSSGDIENRLTAFDERKGYDISELVHPGKTVQIAIEVYDWYGAGGIFRPVTLDTELISNSPRILK